MLKTPLPLSLFSLPLLLLLQENLQRQSQLIRANLLSRMTGRNHACKAALEAGEEPANVELLKKREREEGGGGKQSVIQKWERARERVDKA